MRPRVFVIGFNKCGTSSLHRFFQRSGLRSIHYDHGRLPLKMLDNIKSGQPVMSGYEDYDALTDMNYLCEHVQFDAIEHFRVIMEQEPDAKFILNVRDQDHWVASRLEWGSKRADGQREGDPCSPDCYLRMSYAERYRRYYGFSDLDQVVEHMRAQWDFHTAAVRCGIPHDRLLVFDIERSWPPLLCQFLGLPIRLAEHYGKANASLGPVGKAISKAVPESLSRRISYETKDRVKSLLNGL